MIELVTAGPDVEPPSDRGCQTVSADNRVTCLRLKRLLPCQQRNMKRNGSRGCVTRKTRFGSRERDWLKGDTQRGCVCLYGASVDPQPPASAPQAPSTPQPDLQLVLCSTTTTVEELCAQRNGKGLYVQLHGDLVR